MSTLSRPALKQIRRRPWRNSRGQCLAGIGSGQRSPHSRISGSRNPRELAPGSRSGRQCHPETHQKVPVTVLTRVAETRGHRDAAKARPERCIRCSWSIPWTSL